MSAARSAALVLVAASWVVTTSTAHAYGRGIDVADCRGCHTGGRAPMVRIVASPPDPMPGSLVRLRVEVEALNGAVAGFHLRSGGPGEFRTVAGEGTRLVGEDVVVHSTPSTASGDWVSFDVDWLAPSTAGDVQLQVGGMSGNGDGSSRGDGAASGRLGLVFGCAGTTYYGDLDGDGHGAASRGSIVACAPRAGYASSSDDCDDNDASAYPGQMEACNDEDDDCDLAIDEGLESATVYPDADGDGYGGRGGAPIEGCGRAGYGGGDRDCDDRNAAIHPDALEVCDGRDGDCDGDVDERVRPVCGLGWCRREATTCDATFCSPGEPRGETCNAFDDDCDGDIDEDSSVCAAGETCESGSCTGGGASDGGRRGDAGSAPEAVAGGCAMVPGGRGACWALVALGLALFARRRRSA